MARAGYILVAHDIGASEPALELDERLYLPGIGLFTLCLCYCDRQLTDGRIPRRALRVIAPGVDCGEVLAELERVGFVESTVDGLVVPGYLDWQRSREEVEAAAEKARRASRSRWDAATSNASSNATSNASSNAGSTATRNATEECLRAIRASELEELEDSPSPADADEDVPAVDNSEQDDGFAAFWAAYPRKVGRADALKRWRHLAATDREDATAAAANLAAWQLDSGTELKYIPYPATFIGPKRTFDDWRDGPADGYGAASVAHDPECPHCGMTLCWHEDGNLHCPEHGPVS